MIISAVLVFFVYRRGRNEKSKTCRPSSSQVVKHNAISVPTSTFTLTSQTSSQPIPAAPDYQTLGTARRSSARDMIQDSTSSEEEQYFDANEGLKKYDWSSPQRRKKQAQEKKTESLPKKNAEYSSGMCSISVYLTKLAYLFVVMTYSPCTNAAHVLETYVISLLVKLNLKNLVCECQ